MLATPWSNQIVRVCASPLDPCGIPQPPLRLPPADPGKLGRIQQYLVQQRRINAALLDPFIQSGLVYADTKGNAVVLLLGKENRSVGAELRGTAAQPWHGFDPPRLLSRSNHENNNTYRARRR